MLHLTPHWCKGKEPEGLMPPDLYFCTYGGDPETECGSDCPIMAAALCLSQLSSPAGCSERGNPLAFAGRGQGGFCDTPEHL